MVAEMWNRKGEYLGSTTSLSDEFVREETVGQPLWITEKNDQLFLFAEIRDEDGVPLLKRYEMRIQ